MLVIRTRICDLARAASAILNGFIISLTTWSLAITLGRDEAILRFLPTDGSGLTAASGTLTGGSTTVLANALLLIGFELGFVTGWLVWATIAGFLSTSWGKEVTIGEGTDIWTGGRTFRLSFLDRMSSGRVRLAWGFRWTLLE